MALVQCVLAVLVAAGVAVQPEAPVRRHRAQATGDDDACTTDEKFTGAATWKGKCYTLDKCRSDCRSDSTCVGFNWWPKKGGCRHHSAFGSKEKTTGWSTIGGGPNCKLDVMGPTDCGTCSPCDTGAPTPAPAPPNEPATEWCGKGIRNPLSEPNKCCAATCKNAAGEQECGGSQCGSRVGGAKQCCHSKIEAFCETKDSTGCIIPPAECGDYVIVDRFDGSFWGQRSAMGYVYYQRNAANMNELLTWSASKNVDWGWKEGINYGQLFYKHGNGGTTPSFAASLDAWTADRVNCSAADACQGGGRCSFVKKSVLMSHASWANTKARAAVAVQASCKSEGQYTAYSNGDWVNQLNTAVSRASTTGDGYYAWCNLYGCPQFNSQASAWCNSGGNGACRNQCEALPGGPHPNGGRNGVCTRYGAPKC